VFDVGVDHGFSWKKDRPTTLSNHYRHHGREVASVCRMYLLWGAGIPAGGKNTHDKHGSVRQVCATLLALAGLPQAQGLAGVPLPGTPAAPASSPVDYQAAYHPMPSAPARGVPFGPGEGARQAQVAWLHRG